MQSARNFASRLSLDAERVDVWLMPTAAQDAHLRQACLGLLDNEERARHDRFRVGESQAQFLLGRALLRTVLSCYAAPRPVDWCFDTNAHGRPRVGDVLGLQHVHFNLSHTKGLVVLAVSGLAEIGVDVEHTGRALSSAASLSAAYFSPSEQALLAQAADDGTRTRLFFDLWTLKEAYIKARGLGLALALDSFAFQVPAHDDDGRATSLVCSPRCGDQGERWQFFRLRPTAEHVVAVAVAAAPPAGGRPVITTRWVNGFEAGQPLWHSGMSIAR